MGQTPSTLNPNNNQSSQPTSNSNAEQNYLSQNQKKPGNDLNRVYNVQNSQYQSAPSMKSPYLQPASSKNNIKHLNKNLSNFVRLKGIYP